MAYDGLVLLSQLLGRPVRTTSGSPLGRLADLTVRLDGGRPVVHRLGVRHDGGTALLPWTLVEALDEGPLRVAVDDPARGVEGGELLPDELLLAHDVLDTQVVDLKGHRLSRVADVLLLRAAGGGLELAAVDVGFRALLRRLGPRATRSRPVRPPGVGAVVDWADLHLASERGHLTQLSTAGAGFRRLTAGELAELLARLSTPQAADLLQQVGPEHAAATVHTSDPVTGRRLLGALPRPHAERLLAAAPPTYASHLSALDRAAARPRRRLLRTAGWRVHRPRRTPASGHRP